MDPVDTPLPIMKLGLASFNPRDDGSKCPVCGYNGDDRPFCKYSFSGPGQNYNVDVLGDITTYRRNAMAHNRVKGYRKRWGKVERYNRDEEINNKFLSPQGGVRKRWTENEIREIFEDVKRDFNFKDVPISVIDVKPAPHIKWFEDIIRSQHTAPSVYPTGQVVINQYNTGILKEHEMYALIAMQTYKFAYYSKSALNNFNEILQRELNTGPANSSRILSVVSALQFASLKFVKGRKKFIKGIRDLMMRWMLDEYQSYEVIFSLKGKGSKNMWKGGKKFDNDMKGNEARLTELYQQYVDDPDIESMTGLERRQWIDEHENEKYAVYRIMHKVRNKRLGAIMTQNGLSDISHRQIILLDHINSDIRYAMNKYEIYDVYGYLGFMLTARDRIDRLMFLFLYALIKAYDETKDELIYYDFIDTLFNSMIWQTASPIKTSTNAEEIDNVSPDFKFLLFWGVLNCSDFIFTDLFSYDPDSNETRPLFLNNFKFVNKLKQLQESRYKLNEVRNGVNKYKKWTVNPSKEPSIITELAFRMCGITGSIINKKHLDEVAAARVGIHNGVNMSPHINTYPLPDNIKNDPSRLNTGSEYKDIVKSAISDITKKDFDKINISNPDEQIKIDPYRDHRRITIKPYPDSDTRHFDAQLIYIPGKTKNLYHIWEIDPETGNIIEDLGIKQYDNYKLQNIKNFKQGSGNVTPAFIGARDQLLDETITNVNELVPKRCRGVAERPDFTKNGTPYWYTIRNTWGTKDISPAGADYFGQMLWSHIYQADGEDVIWKNVWRNALKNEWENPANSYPTKYQDDKVESKENNEVPGRLIQGKGPYDPIYARAETWKIWPGPIKLVRVGCVVNGKRANFVFLFVIPRDDDKIFVHRYINSDTLLGTRMNAMIQEERPFYDPEFVDEENKDICGWESGITNFGMSNNAQGDMTCANFFKMIKAMSYSFIFAPKISGAKTNRLGLLYCDICETLDRVNGSNFSFKSGSFDKYDKDGRPVVERISGAGKFIRARLTYKCKKCSDNAGEDRIRIRKFTIPIEDFENVIGGIPWMGNMTCPDCGGDRIITRYRFTPTEIYMVLRCNNCDAMHIPLKYTYDRFQYMLQYGEKPDRTDPSTFRVHRFYPSPIGKSSNSQATMISRLNEFYDNNKLKDMNPQHDNMDSEDRAKIIQYAFYFPNNMDITNKTHMPDGVTKIEFDIGSQDLISFYGYRIPVVYIRPNLMSEHISDIKSDIEGLHCDIEMSEREDEIQKYLDRLKDLGEDIYLKGRQRWKESEMLADISEAIPSFPWMHKVKRIDARVMDNGSKIHNRYKCMGVSNDNLDKWGNGLQSIYVQTAYETDKYVMIKSVIGALSRPQIKDNRFLNVEKDETVVKCREDIGIWKTTGKHAVVTDTDASRNNEELKLKFVFGQCENKNTGDFEEDFEARCSPDQVKILNQNIDTSKPCKIIDGVDDPYQSNADLDKIEIKIEVRTLDAGITNPLYSSLFDVTPIGNLTVAGTFEMDDGDKQIVTEQVDVINHSKRIITLLEAMLTKNKQEIENIISQYEDISGIPSGDYILDEIPLNSGGFIDIWNLSDPLSDSDMDDIQISADEYDKNMEDLKFKEMLHELDTEGTRKAAIDSAISDRDFRPLFHFDRIRGIEGAKPIRGDEECYNLANKLLSNIVMPFNETLKASIAYEKPREVTRTWHPPRSTAQLQIKKSIPFIPGKTTRETFKYKDRMSYNMKSKPSGGHVNYVLDLTESMREMWSTSAEVIECPFIGSKEEFDRYSDMLDKIKTELPHNMEYKDPYYSTYSNWPDQPRVDRLFKLQWDPNSNTAIIPCRTFHEEALKLAVALIKESAHRNDSISFFTFSAGGIGSQYDRQLGNHLTTEGQNSIDVFKSVGLDSIEDARDELVRIVTSDIAALSLQACGKTGIYTALFKALLSSIKISNERKAEPTTIILTDGKLIRGNEPEIGALLFILLIYLGPTVLFVNSTNSREGLPPDDIIEKWNTGPHMDLEGMADKYESTTNTKYFATFDPYDSDRGGDLFSWDVIGTKDQAHPEDETYMIESDQVKVLFTIIEKSGVPQTLRRTPFGRRGLKKIKKHLYNYNMLEAANEYQSMMSEMVDWNRQCRDPANTDLNPEQIVDIRRPMTKFIKNIYGKSHRLLKTRWYSTGVQSFKDANRLISYGIKFLHETRVSQEQDKMKKRLKHVEKKIKKRLGPKARKTSK